MPLPRSTRPATRLTVLALLAALAGSSAHAAAADAKARIKLTPRCYLGSDRGTLVGRGFTPNAAWTAKLAGTRELGSGRTDGRGRIRARFVSPAYSGRRPRKMTLSVTDGPRVASAAFWLTPLSATFAPRSGDPARLRVRWRVLGLGARKGVYLHYVRPNGKHKRTVRLGTASRRCGGLRTGPIALFPFRYTYGTWTFQVDARRRYARRTRPRLEIDFAVKRPSRSRRRRQR